MQPQINAGRRLSCPDFSGFNSGLILKIGMNPIVNSYIDLDNKGGTFMLTWWKRGRLNFRICLFRLLLKLKLAPNLIAYVGSSEALPPPLSNDEEIFLIAKLATGDRTVKTILIERNLRLVVYIARKFENTGVGIEDLVSIGTIGLIKAVNTFDPTKKIKLATYASRCIENEILMYLRRNNKTRSEVSFDEPLNIDWDGNELLLSDVLGTDNDSIYKFIEEEVDKKLLVNALQHLSERERLIVELRFGLRDGAEKTQKEVADFLGISQSYISRLEKRIIRKLKKEIWKLD
jgi:RNA polymerase sporulation-specific sigma factor